MDHTRTTRWPRHEGASATSGSLHMRGAGSTRAAIKQWRDGERGKRSTRPQELLAAQPLFHAHAGLPRKVQRRGLTTTARTPCTRPSGRWMRGGGGRGRRRWTFCPAPLTAANALGRRQRSCARCSKAPRAPHCPQAAAASGPCRRAPRPPAPCCRLRARRR